jgi:peroxiredoxin
LELPTIEKLYKAYKDKGLVILGIDKEEPEPVREFYKKNAVTFPTLADKAGAVTGHYGVNAFPTTLLLDRKGKIISRIVGTEEEQPLQELQFRRLLQKAGLR